MGKKLPFVFLGIQQIVSPMIQMFSHPEYSTSQPPPSSRAMTRQLGNSRISQPEGL